MIVNDHQREEVMLNPSHDCRSNDTVQDCSVIRDTNMTFQSNTIEGSFNTKFNDIKPVGIFYS